MNVKSSPDTRLSEIVNHQGKTIKRRSVIIGSQAKVNRVRDRAAYPPLSGAYPSRRSAARFLKVRRIKVNAVIG